MTETLLSPSNVLLFGRKVADLEIVVPNRLAPGVTPVGLASTREYPIDQAAPGQIDNENVRPGQLVLLKDQADKSENGVYKIVAGRFDRQDQFGDGSILFTRRGRDNRGKMFRLKHVLIVEQVNGEQVTKDGLESEPYEGERDPRHGPFSAERGGLASEIEQQLLSGLNPCFARIYGFSFEGSYYELARPVIFLVHGDGLPASEARTGVFGRPRPSRAPGDPSLTGIGSAGFEFSDDVLVWSYDKSDYTIRLDVETGMFDDVLLDTMLGGGSDGMDTRGMNARGMNARGMNARGMNARGMNARGMNARGNSD